MDALRPQEGQTDLRSFEWYYLWRQNNRARLTLPAITRASDNFDLMYPDVQDSLTDRRRLVFSPNGKLLATRWRICDAAGRQLVEYDEAKSSKIFFSPDSKFVWTGAMIVDLATGKRLKLPLSPKGGRIRTESGTPFAAVVVDVEAHGDFSLWGLRNRSRITQFNGRAETEFTRQQAPGSGPCFACAAGSGC